MKILNKKVLIVIILFFSFLIFNRSNCFAYDNYFNFKLDGTDDVFFDRSTMKLTVNDNVYNLVCNNLPENYTNISVVRESYSAGETWGIFFTPSTADKLKLFNPYYSSRKNLNDYDIYYLTRPTKTECTVYRTGEGACYINSCRFSTIDVYDYLDKLVCAGVKKTLKVTPTLYIDDQNLKKRFKFQFEIPLEKEDTKYYVFLQKYTRNSYNSVTATFTIYTVSTPENYDATNYENYMYYDNSTKELKFPAGCSIKEYSAVLNNGNTAKLESNNNFISERINVGSLTHFSYSGSVFIEDKYSLSDLIPVDYAFTDFSFSRFFGSILKALTFSAKDDDTGAGFTLGIDNFLDAISPGTKWSSFAYQFNLRTLYYGKEELNSNFNDFAFSNFSIVSYENYKYDNECNSYFYNIYRKTKVYNQENKINDNMFAFNYSDGQDVSSLLPDGLDVGYLTSPWFKDNEKSTSKGNITYDINEIIQGDKIIDYSKEDNSIHNNFNGDYIENFKEGDNITINNYYTETIEKTSDSNLLHNIYVAILEIKQLLSSTNDKISNTTNNLTYNVSNTVTYLLVPTSLGVQTELEKLDNSAKEHLGIIYEPFDLLIYTVTLFTNIDNSTEIVLSAPAVSWKDHEIIPVTNFSFNQFFDQAPKFKEIHDIYLMSVDFIVIGLLLYLAYKKFKEVFNK